MWREVCSLCAFCIPVNNTPPLRIDLLYGNSGPTTPDRSAELVGTVLIMCT